MAWSSSWRPDAGLRLRWQVGQLDGVHHTEGSRGGTADELDLLHAPIDGPPCARELGLLQLRQSLPAELAHGEVRVESVSALARLIGEAGRQRALQRGLEVMQRIGRLCWMEGQLSLKKERVDF